tara:strand:- start:2733 stop:3107 length:375 start_codon:yes stop_codon:yes gene_type:complete
MKPLYLSKLSGKSKLEVQKEQQRSDMNSKAKGTAYENELVNKLNNAGFAKVKRAWGSDGRSMGEAPDVDILADGIKIQAKRRRSIPKWLSMGNCDVVMYREDRGITFVTMTFDDWLRCLKNAPS